MFGENLAQKHKTHNNKQYHKPYIKENTGTRTLRTTNTQTANTDDTQQQHTEWGVAGKETLGYAQTCASRHEPNNGEPWCMRTQDIKANRQPGDAIQTRQHTTNKIFNIFNQRRHIHTHRQTCIQNSNNKTQ